MNTNYDFLLKKTEEYVTGLLVRCVPNYLKFHNIDHTREVVDAAKIIGQETGLTDEEMLVVLLAAWFHDSGFIVRYEGHEDESKRLAKEFLEKQQVKTEIINRVLNCIEATKMPQSPESLEAKVLCDADLFHLSQEYFFDRTYFILEERNNRQPAAETSEFEYLEETLMFFKMHVYQTTYAQEVLEAGKKKNQKKLKKKIKKQKEKHNKKEEKLNQKIEKLQNKIHDFKSPARGIETMFRVTARNQINLSSIADNKANIMISINAIIISVVVTGLATQIGENKYLIVPFLVLILVCLVTLISAILATRPNLSMGKFTEEEVDEKRVNLLFFGNFYNMDLGDYTAAVKKMMKDYDYLYESLIKDQFFLGKALGKKYKLLKTTYNIFMFGLILTVISFAVAFITYHV